MVGIRFPWMMVHHNNQLLHERTSQKQAVQPTCGSLAKITSCADASCAWNCEMVCTNVTCSLTWNSTWLKFRVYSLNYTIKIAQAFPLTLFCPEIIVFTFIFSNSLWICDEIIPNYNIPTEMSNTKSSSKNIKTYELTSIIATFTMLMKWLK